MVGSAGLVVGILKVFNVFECSESIVFLVLSDSVYAFVVVSSL